MRASELGVAGAPEHCIRTHIGHLLTPGDSVHAYNLHQANVNNEEFDKLNMSNVPDVVSA